MKQNIIHQSSANSEQRTANSEQRTANSEQQAKQACKSMLNFSLCL